MNKLILTKGLPASGKTTWAEQYCLDNPNTKNICKDNLRSENPKAKESDIIDLRNLLTELYIVAKNDIIWSDTNFNPIHENKAKEFCKQYGYELEIKEFDTPLDECIERDLKRDKSVGSKVIEKMYYQYVYKPQIVEYNPNLPDCYIFDIDGTLANMSDRSPYDWSKVQNDTPNENVIDILNILTHFGNQIFIFSGRNEICREATIEWLLKYTDLTPGFLDKRLFMRPQDLTDKDTDLKEFFYISYIQDQYNVKGILDDRPSVCRRWRSLGLPVFQVGNPHLEF
jgi:predicted kinase